MSFIVGEDEPAANRLKGANEEPGPIHDSRQRGNPPNLIFMPPPSPQGFAAKEIVLILVLILGVLAAFAYYKFQKVRQTSEDQTVLCVVRQLSAAADQYYLENGVSTAELRQLIGATNYIKAIQTVAGETSPQCRCGERREEPSIEGRLRAVS